MRTFLAITLGFLLLSHCHGQDSIPNRKRLNLLRYGGASVYGASMLGLSKVWYSQSARQSFHFFNDASEWKQMDKVGHFYNTFQLSSITYRALSWAGSNEKKRA